ncbi:hypothetical protein [Sphingopyxis flava]|uniref:Capsid Gp10A/Gp10B-like domain-containing protein n=1 Tax=Sphingopyxis flava TaxID=1507287 RepID=A0A1T5BSC3_9SPHN|nr:hypothetical protein [Sphingopyxis flava]SKB49740.1 hypothetical protein SAMN06295937_100769 [Sphingopyxis flava]
MANSNPSRPGLREGGSDALELMLDVRGGEVLTAYNAAVVMHDKHKTQSLKGAKSVKFPAFWNATAEYHTPGVEILGGSIPSQDITVTPDDKLISAVFVADVDEALFDVDVRSPYTEAIGRELAEHYDRNVMRAILVASRAGALFTGDQGGGSLTDANFASSATALFDGISEAKELMDTKRVPVDSQPVYGVLPTAQWYIMARSDRNLNRDYNGGQSDIRRHVLTTIDDVQITKSNVANGVFGVNSSSDTKIPSYYRINAANSRGIVFTPYAAASVVVQDLGFQMVDQPEKQGVLLIGRRMVGTRALRSKAAVELKIA